MSDAWAIAAGWLALILLFSGPGRIPESADRVDIQFGRKSELLLLKFHIVHTGHRYGHDVLDRWGPKSLELDRSRDRIQPFQGMR
jgi:hypothetical protein